MTSNTAPIPTSDSSTTQNNQVTIATIGNLEATIPPEFKQLNDNLYNKISLLIGGGGQAVDILKDKTLMLNIVFTALTVVRAYRDANGEPLNNTQQKTITLTLIKCVIADLYKAGAIKQEDALMLINNSDMFFGIPIDVAFLAASGVVKVGEEIVDAAEDLITDAKTMGCSASCKKNCCCGGNCTLF